MIERTLLWTPRAKGRPRTVAVGGGYRTYTPHETVAAEAALAAQWVGTPTDDLISVVMDLSDETVHLVIEPSPAPVSKKLMRGDLDNYAKLVLDSLNGRAWVDDRQIVALKVRKL